MLKLFNPIHFDRKVADGKIIHFLIPVLLLPVIIWVVGYIGQYVMTDIGNPMQGFRNGLLWETYESYINPNGHENWTLSFSHRLYLFLVGVFGVFLLNGVLVSMIYSWVESRGKRWHQGLLHYDGWNLFSFGKPLKNFAVIIGGNELVPDLARQLLERNDIKYVLIMTNREVPVLRKKLMSLLGKDEERIVIYHGERTSEEDLRCLQLSNTKAIYVIGEQLDIDQSGSHHDVKNMECVKLMARLIPKDGVKKLCRVMFEYQSSFSVFQFTDINDEISDVMDFRPFNYYETWAQKVFVCQDLHPTSSSVQYLPLEGEQPITFDSEDTVHLIIAGMSRMGMAMGIEAAYLAHYPNFIKGDGKGRRTRITFIDSIAREEMRFMQGHYKEMFAVSRWRYIEAGEDDIYYNQTGHIPYSAYDGSWKDPLHDEQSHSVYHDTRDYTLGCQLVDVDWEFIQGKLETPTVQCYIRDAAKQPNARLTIAICFSRDNASFAASLYLPDEVYEENNNVVQVLAYQPYGDAMCQSFKTKIEMRGGDGKTHPVNFNQFGKLKAFGMMSNCYSIQNQENMEEAANQLWEQYDAIYNKHQSAGRSSSEPLKAGKSLAARQWSNSYAAAHLWTKLRNIEWKGEKELNSDSQVVLAKLEHVRWNMEQLLLGFAPLRPDEQHRLMSKQGQAFSDEKELLKANMSHADLCSFEVLEKIDKGAIQYDMNLTNILPTIYEKIHKPADSAR